MLIITGGLSGSTSVAAQTPHEPALLLPFPAGPGEIVNGYDDDSFHTGPNACSLDLCAGMGCTRAQVGDPVLAPTDLTYVWSADYNGVDGDADDYRGRVRR